MGMTFVYYLINIIITNIIKMIIIEYIIISTILHYNYIVIMIILSYYNNYHRSRSSISSGSHIQTLYSVLSKVIKLQFTIPLVGPTLPTNVVIIK